MRENRESKKQESKNLEPPILDTLILDFAFGFREGLDTLLGLVSRYSPSGEEAEAVNFLVNRMLDLGFTHTYRDEVGNAIGVMGAGPKQIILLGHIDTVPGEVPIQLDEAGRLFGRGTVDAKGPLAAFVDAVAEIGPVEGSQFIVIGAVDEENESKGARAIVDQYSPDFVIIGEPSGWDRITLGYKGFARVKLKMHRERVHGAAEGPTVSESAVEVWTRIKAANDGQNLDRTKNFERVDTRLTGIQSGENGVTQWAQLQIEARLPEDLSPGEWLAWLGHLAADSDIVPGGYHVPAYRSAKNSPLIRSFLRGIRAVDGAPRFVLKSGTSDMNTVAPVWKCPIVAYGPGDSTLDHTPNEHIVVGEYLFAVRVLAAVLRDL